MTALAVLAAVATGAGMLLLGLGAATAEGATSKDAVKLGGLLVVVGWLALSVAVTGWLLWLVL